MSTQNVFDTDILLQIYIIKIPIYDKLCDKPALPEIFEVRMSIFRFSCTKLPGIWRHPNPAGLSAPSRRLHVKGS